MHGAESSYIDIVLLAMIALFLGLRLRSILGTRTGFEGAPPQKPAPAPRPGSPVINAPAEPVSPALHPLPDASTPIGQALAQMRRLDPRFDPTRFLNNAEAAFRLIVTAFTEGARDRLRPLLTDPTFRAFDQAIAMRAGAGQTQHTEIKEMLDIVIEDAKIAGTIAAITVRFVSRQINYTKGAEGDMVAGTDGITELADLWRFERDLTGTDPAWRLAAARSA